MGPKPAGAPPGKRSAVRNGEPPLLSRLREREEDGLVPFDAFMDVVLYDPDHGYFSTGSERAGRSGDFLTAPEVSPLFARVVFGWIERRWRATGAKRFAYVEAGAGRGTLAMGIAQAAAESGASDRLDLHLVERGAAARTALATALPRAHVYADVDALPPTLGAGVFVANELFDNLPVRRVMQGDGLQEICLKVRGAKVREELRPAPPDLLALAHAHGLRLSAGQSAEVSPTASILLEAVLARFDAGGFLVFDYGGEAHEVSGEQAPNGTVAAHKGHARHADLYADLGRQDITADVNFTPLRAVARDAGFTTDLVSQGRFLVREGLPERLQTLVGAARDDFERLRLTQLAKQLYHPEAMGDAFKVLVGERIRGHRASTGIT